MKKFQESLKQKAHLTKIKNAKKTIPITGRVQTGGKSTTQKISQQSKLLLNLYDNKSYDAIPAYKLLRTAGLQQYTRGFIIRGYGINLGKLALINQKDKQKLYEDLKVLPGHTIKLDKLIQILGKNSYSYSNEYQLLNNFSQDTYQQESQKSIISSSKQSRKKSNFQDLDYQRQLEKVINQYTPHQVKKKTTFHSKISQKSNISGSVSGSGRQKYTKTNYNYQGGSNKMIDFNKKPPLQSSKSTVKKSTITSTTITSKINNNNNNKSNNNNNNNNNNANNDQSHKRNLAKILKNTTPGSKIDSKKVMEIDLQIDKVKNLYRSFDGALMSSTIANIDLQELIYSFAGYIFSKVIPAINPNLKNNINVMNIKEDNIVANMKRQKYRNYQQQYQSQEKCYDPQQTQNIQDQVGQILRESYMHPLYINQSQNQVNEQIQVDLQGQEALSQGQNDIEQEEQKELPCQVQYHSMEKQKSFGQSSFLGGQSYDFGIDQPLKIFDEPQPSDIDYFKPTIDSIFNFIKNVVLAAKMERQIPIMAANYIQTFLLKAPSNFKLTSLNYKRVLVSTLLLASKIWDDQSFQSPSFAKTFPQYNTVLLNQMQKQILKRLDYKLKLDKKQYARTFFELRKHRKANYKSYQNRRLNLNKIRELQSGVKRQYKSQLLTKRPSY